MFFKDAKNSRNLDVIIAIIIAVICVVFYKFSKVAIRAGRLKELLITTPILLASIYFSNHYIYTNCDFFSLKTIFWCCVIPLAIYSIYWIILLNFFPKITSHKASANWADKDWWMSLDGWEFEEEVARVFRLNGYKVKLTKKTGDGGTDLIMYKGEDKYLVQCKHYTNEVPVEPIRALNGIREDYGADKLILVASSGITKAGKEFIENKPYFKVLILDDIIDMGLRPSEA